MSDQTVSPSVDCLLKENLGNSNDTKCNFTSLTLSKGTRKVVINDKTPDSKNYLSVISGYKNKKSNIKGSADVLIGPCKATHQKKVWFVAFPTKSKNDKDVEFEVSSDKKVAMFQLGQSNPVNYNLVANTCGKKYNVDVKVYPDTNVAFLIRVKDFGETKTTLVNSKYKSKCKNKYETEKSYFEVDFTYKEDGKELELSAEFKSVIEKIGRCFSVKDKLLGVLKKNINRKGSDGKLIETDYASFAIKYPLIEVGGKWYWEEKDGSQDCKFVKQISVAAEPLIQAEGTLNITNIIIAAFTEGTAVKALNLTKD